MPFGPGIVLAVDTINEDEVVFSGPAKRPVQPCKIEEAQSDLQGDTFPDTQVDAPEASAGAIVPHHGPAEIWDDSQAQELPPLESEESQAMACDIGSDEEHSMVTSFGGLSLDPDVITIGGSAIFGVLAEATKARQPEAAKLPEVVEVVEVDASQESLENGAHDGEGPSDAAGSDAHPSTMLKDNPFNHAIVKNKCTIAWMWVTCF